MAWWWRTSVASAKYVDALPFYRQSTQFERLGLEAPRQTLARWMVQCGEPVQPLVNLLRDGLLDSGYLRMDETTVQVLKERGRAAQSTSYLWVQQSGEREQPVLETLRAWLDTTAPKVVPGRPLGKALGYLDRHWDGLVRYCEDGRLEIDNNLCENAIRPFVMGRKNWLTRLSDTVRSAQASANLYSHIEAAKANGLDPCTYLRRVFTALPAATTVADIEGMLPWAPLND